MPTTETTTDVVTAARATIFARMIHGLTADGDARPAFEQAKRVAQAVRTERQRAILWLHQTLNHAAVTWEILIALEFDQQVVDAADTLGRRCRESVLDYAKRVAPCDDTDVLAVAVALMDNQIEVGVELPDGTLAAYKEARRVLKRAADTLANQQLGATPPDGGVADDRPTEPALRTAVMTFMEHTDAARDAMVRIMHRLQQHGESWEIRESDLKLLLGTVHDMMLVVALLVVELTAKQNDKTSAEERMRLFRTKTFREGIETFTRTIARRLRDLCDGGEESENGTVH